MKLTTGLRIGVLVTFVCLFGMFNQPAQAGHSCEDYPYSDGDITAVKTPDGPKILATAAVSVDFDDTDEVLDAKKEARIAAKAAIVKFFEVEIKESTDTTTLINKRVKITKGPKGALKSGEKEKIKTTIKKLSENAGGLLRGVVPLSSCYTKGKMVMVSVGLKPETVKAAESGTGMIKESIRATTKQPATAQSTDKKDAKPTVSGGQYKTRTKGPDSHSKGLKKLKDF